MIISWLIQPAPPSPRRRRRNLPIRRKVSKHWKVSSARLDAGEGGDGAQLCCGHSLIPPGSPVSSPDSPVIRLSSVLRRPSVVMHFNEMKSYTIMSRMNCKRQTANGLTANWWPAVPALEAAWATLKMYNYLRGFIRLPILNFSSRPETAAQWAAAVAVLGERQWQLHGHGRRQTINKRPNVCNELYTTMLPLYIYITILYIVCLSMLAALFRWPKEKGFDADFECGYSFTVLSAAI